MTTIPCSRAFSPPGRAMTTCREGQLCGNCSAIRTMKATMLGVADHLEHIELSYRVGGLLEGSFGRLRADVARVEG